MRKIVRVIVGFVMLVGGLIMALPGVPGPGLLIALGGLIVLSEHFHWARRTLNWLKRRGAQVRAGLKANKPGP